MKRLILCLFIMLTIPVPDSGSIADAVKHVITDNNRDKAEQKLTPMEALDLVKERYAANFDKRECDDTIDEYYYKLPAADYYLVYEGEVGPEQNYLIHLYEVVIDEPDTGICHAFTYGWFVVNKKKGIVKKILND